MTTYDTAYDLSPEALDPDGLHSPLPGSAPRERAWFYGDAPLPAGGPLDQDSIGEEIARVPLLLTAQELLEVIGEGCRLTKQGRMYAVDIRRFEKQSTTVARWERWPAFGMMSRAQLAWEMLTGSGWLLCEDGWVRPARTRSADEEPLAGADASDLQDLLLAALAAIGRWQGFGVAHSDLDDDVLEGILLASGPEGLELPEVPPGRALLHCEGTRWLLVELLRFRRIHDVPIDSITGHVQKSAISRLLAVRSSLEDLVLCGLVCCDADVDPDGWDDGESDPQRIYRTSALLCRAVLALLEQRRSPGATAGSDEERARW